MIDKLEFLVALARERNFSKAAEQSGRAASWSIGGAAKKHGLGSGRPTAVGKLPGWRRSRRLMSSSSADKLVVMANQMGRFFVPQRGIDPAAAIANHINKFWEPRMRAAIVAHLETGGAGMDGPVREAVGRLKEASKG